MIDQMPPPPFQVRTAGMIKNAPYHSTPGSKQGDIMLTLFIAGHGCYRNEDFECEVRTGMAGLTFPEKPGILTADPEDPYQHYFCRFNGAYAFALARYIVEQRSGNFFHVSAVDELVQIFRRIVPRSSRDLPRVMGMKEVYLAQLLLTLADFHQPQGSSPSLSPLSLEEYLETHIADPTDLDMIARHFQVSRSTLCRSARQFFNTTVQKLHERKKMEWAKQLLLLKDLSLREISLRLGYNDPLYFSRRFKRHHGCSPRTWRRNHDQRGNSRQS